MVISLSASCCWWLRVRSCGGDSGGCGLWLSCVVDELGNGREMVVELLFLLSVDFSFLVECLLKLSPGFSVKSNVD